MKPSDEVFVHTATHICKHCDQGIYLNRWYHSKTLNVVCRGTGLYMEAEPIPPLSLRQMVKQLVDLQKELKCLIP